MRKFLKVFAFSLVLIMALSLSGLAEEFPEPQIEPLSPQYLEWLEEHQNNDSDLPPLLKSGNGNEDYTNGYIPFHIDLSHLDDNPPVEESYSPIPLYKAGNIPETYDLRNVGGNSYVTGIKSQGSYGTCWAHAAIGAIESNLIKNGLGINDLSEMHLAWFAFRNSDKSKAFHNLTSAAFATVMDHGGNAFYPTALFSRLAGPATESEVPYGSSQPSKSTPESYSIAVRLRDVYYLRMGMKEGDRLNVNVSSTERDNVKRRIMENGSVMASYYDNQSNNKEYYNKSSNGTAYYYTGGGYQTNHAVQIVGWNDKFSRSNFKNNPGMDGAWLIKNSWGTSFGDSGYFWMSYAQYLTDGTAFTAEKVDPDMKVYDYSPLGWCSTWGWQGPGKIYSANVFKSERNNEKLKEVGFYTPDNNVKYQVSVYTGMTSMPSSSPVNGSPVATLNGTMPYAGWHILTLNSPVALTNGQYFSVVVTFTNCEDTAVEMKGSMAPNAVIDTGSFFSYDGTRWETGSSNNVNATVKAYTVSNSSSTGTAPKIVTASLPDGKVNQAYSETLTATGTSPITWSIASGTLPSGLSLDPSTGVISGTPKTAGTSTFTVKATNNYGNVSAPFTITVAASGSAPSITTASLPDGVSGKAYSHTLTATGTTPISWAAGTLPSGLTMDASTGVLSGTPSASGSYTITITASNAIGKDSKSFTLRIAAAGVTPKITTSSLPDGKTGQSYSQTLSATGTAPITWSASGLPSGLSINSSTGVISGTPSTAGNYSVTVTAKNNYGTGSKTYQLKITASGTPPTITTSSLPDGQINQSYSQTLSATGTTPITWSASGLPSGLSVKSSTGVISGTPTTAGLFNITVTAKNSYGTASQSLKLNISSPTPGGSVTVTGYAGYQISEQLTPSTATWSVSSGRLPSGLSLSRSGLISGRPSGASDTSVTLKAVTSSETTEVTVYFKIEPKPVKPSITTSSLKDAVVGTSYSQALTATGTAPITLTVTGLPSGLSFNGTSNTITGTPSAVGTFRVTVKAENLSTQLDKSNVTKTLQLKVKAQPPVIADPGKMPDGIMGEVYPSVQFALTSGTEPVTWSVSGQPAGLRMSSTGLLSGTPTRAGNFTMTVRASNAGGNTSIRVAVQILQKPTVNSARMVIGTTDRSYTARFTARGTSPIKWTFEGLPEPMTYSQNTAGTAATVTGIPVKAGTFSVKMILTNDAGSTEYRVDFTVRGVAPRLTTTLARGREGQSFSGSRIFATGTKPIDISYSISASDMQRFGINSLEDIGLSFSNNPDEGTATITGTPTISLKNLPITFTAKNSVSTVSRRAVLTIAGDRPVFTQPSESSVNMTCKISTAVNMNFKVTGSRKITYTMNNVNGFSLSQTGDYEAVLTGTAPARDTTTTLTVTASNADGRAVKRVVIRTQTPPSISGTTLPNATLNKNYSARLTATGTRTITWSVEGTLPAGIRFSNGTFSGRPTAAGNYTFTIKAKNAIGEDSKQFTISVTDPNAKTSAQSDTKSEYTQERSEQPMNKTGEGSLTFGEVAEVSEAHLQEVKAMGYTVAALLPEVSADVSGMYEIDAELFDYVPEGAELVWLAFAEEGKASDDDEIAEFYDDEGTEITRVPKSHKITVSAWLNKGVKYSPVIAVR